MNLFSVNWLHVKIEHRLHRREEAPVFKNVAFGVCGGGGQCGGKEGNQRGLWSEVNSVLSR